MASYAFQTKFYVVGGTLSLDAPCYVKRQADTDLYHALNQGDFCYLLTSRQMGKSSLMVRMAVQLRQEGAAIAVLDLTAFGQNLSTEQWYDSLLTRLGQQLDLEDELDEFWLKNTRLGPLHRWMRALREVVLTHYTGQVVIFIDEIDTVRSLPFSTDEFFAAIREFYNGRTQDADLKRLTFCLLGVATPADLIQDTRTTPFNIGRRIDLTDFTEAEAAPLAKGLAREENLALKLLQQVLYWTGGHPYLSQRLCQTVADHPEVTSAEGVDKLCDELFLSFRARERDDNILFVRERLLRSQAQTSDLLNLYSQVHGGERVAADEANPLVSILQLSGITRIVDGCLQVRNRIYQTVFDQEWVKFNSPAVHNQPPAVDRKRSVAVITTALLLGIAVVLLYITFKHQPGPAFALADEAQHAKAPVSQQANVMLGVEADHKNAEPFIQQDAVELESVQGEEMNSRVDLATWQTLVDIITWKMIKTDSDPLTFKAYLEVYPNGEFAELAERKIRAVKIVSRTPTNGIIIGRVYDIATNQSISGATVSVKSQVNGMGQSVFTNTEGQFLMAILPPALYTVTIEHPKYEEKWVSDYLVSPEKINRMNLQFGGLRRKL